MAQHFKQAAQQAPWRSRFQRISLILLGLVVAAVMTILHLYITAQTYTTQVEINALMRRRAVIINQIADLQSRTAFITSTEQMHERSKDLDYRQTNDYVVYLPIRDYAGRQFEYQAASTQASNLPSYLNPLYTQSIWEWLFEHDLINIILGAASQL